ncbi:hypothetical protein M231_02407 [Tremella mesenterica]|uniref:2-dehydropantoate 2-reductase n=1 Tax=Tremella mesenterica TaxID=5217 RepID=A0A4Q1BQT0_TREME|nr:hypothetical protein M231_02407 [Tremella mesenterica]
MTANGISKPLEILLIGLGSVGSVYAYCLENAGRARVTAVARSNYNLYTTTGVTLKTNQFGTIENWRPYKVVKSQEEALAGDVKYDYCLITTKCLPDVNPTSKLVEPVINSGKVGAFVLVQNGLDVEVDLYEAVKEKNIPIVSSCIWIGIMTSPDGGIVHWGGGGTAVMGIYPPAAVNEIPNETSKSALEIWYAATEGTGLGAKIADNIKSVRFTKNIGNVMFSSLQSLTRTTSEVFDPLPPSIQAHVKAYMHEILEVGFKSGLLYKGAPFWPSGNPLGSLDELAESTWDFITRAAAAVASGQTTHRMSMTIDVDLGRPIEVEVIVGSVLRLAEEYKVDTPRLGLIYALLKALQGDLVSKQKSRIA